MAAAQQYLGSKLCIISKALMRYEGILHSIDPVQSTLTLANVKCFGTENRSEKFVPHSDKIYGHISFKGCNLKDIFMCDVDKKTDLPDPAIIEHSDPVRPNSASSSISYSNLVSSVGRVSSTNFQPTFVPTPIGMPPSTYSILSQNNENLAHLESNLNQPSLPSSRSVSPIHNNHHKKSPTHDQSTQMTPMTKDYRQTTHGGPSKYGKNFIPKNNNEIDYSYDNQAHNRRDNFNQPINRPFYNQFHQYQSRPGPSANNFNYNMNKFGYNRAPPFHPAPGGPKYQNYASQSHRATSAIGTRPHSSMNHSGAVSGRSSNNKDLLTKTELKQYTEEFNFEEMNAQFNKESLHKEFEEKLKLDAAKKGSVREHVSTLLPASGQKEEVGAKPGSSDPKEEVMESAGDAPYPGDPDQDGGHVEIGHPQGAAADDVPICYDKAKSFFDNISCQNNRNGHLSKPPFRQFFPQKVNTETFGLNQQQGGGSRPSYFNNNNNNNYGYGNNRPSPRSYFGTGNNYPNSRFVSSGSYPRGAPGGGQYVNGARQNNAWNFGSNQGRKFPGPSSSAGGAH